MEIQIPLQVALEWIGSEFTSDCDVYQFEFGGAMLQIQLFESHAEVLSTKDFSVEALHECHDHFRLIGVY